MEGLVKTFLHLKKNQSREKVPKTPFDIHSKRHLGSFPGICSETSRWNYSGISLMTPLEDFSWIS